MGVEFDMGKALAGMLIAAAFAAGGHLGSQWSPGKAAMNDAYKDGYEDGYEAGWEDHAADEWDPPTFQTTTAAGPLGSPAGVFLFFASLIAGLMLGGFGAPWVSEQWGRYAAWARGEDT